MMFVVDLETTALRPEKGGVWDLGVVAVHDGAVAGEFQTLVWPGRHCLQSEHLSVIERVSGLTPGEILPQLLAMGVPDVATARVKLIDWLYTHLDVRRAGEDVRGPKCVFPQCNGAGFWWEGPQGDRRQRFCDVCQGTGKLLLPRVSIPLTAFNRPFDLGWLEAQPWQFPWFVRALGHAELTEVPCVMAAAAKEIRTPNGRVKLSSACAYFGVPPGTAHRAIDDARAAAHLAIKLGIEARVEPSRRAA